MDTRNKIPVVVGLARGFQVATVHVDRIMQRVGFRHRHRVMGQGRVIDWGPGKTLQTAKLLR